MRIFNNIKLPRALLVLLLVISSINLSAQTTYGPYLTDVWGGVNCVDNSGNKIYPLNNFTPNHCSPGCVAISLSQVLHFYEWPKTGIDNNVYSENYNGTQYRHSAAFDGIQYDWNNMQEHIQYDYLQAERHYDHKLAHAREESEPVSGNFHGKVRCSDHNL